METAISLAIAFALGVISSAVFWRALLFVKPNLEISREAVLDPNTNRLGIKVINRSRRYAKDVKASFVIVDRFLEGDLPVVNVLKEMPLTDVSPPILAPIQDLHKAWLPPTIKIFTTEILTDDLTLLMSPARGERRLKFTLVATDALSSTTDVWVQTYGPRDVKLGRFDDWTSPRFTGVSLEELAQRVSDDE